jgi:hypothetical protein
MGLTLPIFIITISAENDMDAENQSQQIIKNANEKEI